ncbi:hypothetical protein [Actinomadura roseirufa]|uniref:hypothetical protein n=1 Tax=Actinomadura roseirufa TaxID=2094049 RepID=UPI0010419F59|nr:hypothetical protein [Actinomadura roseirufa]
MSRPLPPGDPAQLGPYRLSARLSETPAGIVFLGVDGAGRRASVAVLNQGAAGDAAARDRFRAAINAAVPGAGRRAVPSGVPGGGGPGGEAPVVAAQPDGPAPWVATVYEAERVGAERFLEPVLLDGVFRGRWGGGRRRGPGFQPYWLGSGEPALERPGPPPGMVAPVPVGERPPERSLVAATVTLAGALLVLALLMGVLFACQPRAKEPPPQPPEPTPQVPVPSRTPVPQSPVPPPVSPSPPPSVPPTAPPSDGDGGGGGPV